MSDISVNDQIVKLVELQKIDYEIYDLKGQLEEKPALLEEKKELFEGKKAKLHELEEKLKTIQLGRKEQELELKVKEEGISKSNAQLSAIKTNKEYTAKISEIENIKADMSVIEDKILLSYEEFDRVNADVEKEKSNVAEEEKKYFSQKAEIEGEVKAIKDRIKVLESQKTQVGSEVDPAYLDMYEKILMRKNGLAIVPLNGSICGGCHLNVLPQEINNLKKKQELVYCEKCNRIIYLEEDL
ncbi:MAG: hypothetical protein KKF78_05120 [Candidatus Omnitrophica bacterium]|nr:hypothetical protein [Candidatus Omnitrophota bacterium]MBU1996519.1 hypothetical protein [Candidatus Omnitrophota bacterium]